MFNLCLAFELIAKELDMSIDQVAESFEWTAYDTEQAHELIKFYDQQYQSIKEDENRYKILIESVD